MALFHFYCFCLLTWLQLVACIGGCDNRMNELLLESNRKNMSIYFSGTAPSRPQVPAASLGNSYLILIIIVNHF